MTLDPALHARLKRFLPPEILNALPNSQALTAGIRRLNSLYQAISSFLPQYIAENEELLTQDHGQLRAGTFLFADVSGFTALSELLQRHGGSEGTDILTEIINHFFATMLEILAKSNGELLKFAGDALLAFFPQRAGVHEAPHAIRTGLRMQRAMKASFQPIQHKALDALMGDHHLELTMSIGVCRGQLFEALVGDDIQRDLVIQGDLPGRAMAAEEAGERDDVIVDADLKDAYATLFETTPTREPGFFRVVDNFGSELSDYEFVVPRRRRAQASAIFDLLAENLLDDLIRQLERVEIIARFVAAEVVNTLALKGDEIEAQNRPATVIFTYFSGIQDLLSAWGPEHLDRVIDILDRYYCLMRRTVNANGGSITRSDPYKQGVKLLITFGAPVAYPDDPERAVTTALEMNRQLALLNAQLQDELPKPFQREVYIQHRQGITHGIVFATEAGWRARREYTVMGDDVNLAARLMGKGEMGQTIINTRMWERVHTHFETEALPPFLLKGKSEPTPAFLVKTSTASIQDMSPTSETPFTGRDMQLLMLTYGLQQAKGPRRRQGFALVGEPGVGKTRMAKHVAAAADQARFKVAWANCQIRHGQAQGVWAAVIEQLLDLGQAKSEAARRRLLNTRLAELDLLALEPVFSDLVFGSFEQVPQHVPVPEQLVSPAPPAARRRSSKTDMKGLFDRLIEEPAPEQPAAAAAQEAPIVDQLPQPPVDLAGALVQFLSVYATRSATLLVFDDVHLAAPPVWDTLAHIVREITRARLAVLVTYQHVEGFSLDLPRTLTVTDLDSDESRQLMARVLNVRQVGSRLFDLVWSRTNGRPLFIESLLRLLEEEGHITRAGHEAELAGELPADTLPDNVRELVISQFDRLPGNERLVLQAASALGNGFTLPELAAVKPDQQPAHLEAALKHLIEVQVLDLHPDGSYRFRHGVTEAVLYETLNRHQRRALHRAAAAYWTGQPPSNAQMLTAAHHLIKAGASQEARRLILAAAERTPDPEHAREVYMLGLDLFPGDAALTERLAHLQGTGDD